LVAALSVAREAESRPAVAAEGGPVVALAGESPGLVFLPEPNVVAPDSAEAVGEQVWVLAIRQAGSTGRVLPFVVLLPARRKVQRIPVYSCSSS
jgi:hypothetical protein